mmetsp:Transcript_10741/g.23369  ORF Transcript_10741/g.23369 Transcript_10741/m.23369 type:complete len:223 (-) Transcript_10741:72-740(-)
MATRRLHPARRRLPRSHLRTSLSGASGFGGSSAIRTMHPTSRATRCCTFGPRSRSTHRCRPQLPQQPLPPLPPSPQQLAPTSLLLTLVLEPPLLLRPLTLLPLLPNAPRTPQPALLQITLLALLLEWPPRLRPLSLRQMPPLVMLRTLFKRQTLLPVMRWWASPEEVAEHLHKRFGTGEWKAAHVDGKVCAATRCHALPCAATRCCVLPCLLCAKPCALPVS